MSNSSPVSISERVESARIKLRVYAAVYDDILARSENEYNWITDEERKAAKALADAFITKINPLDF